MIVLNNRDYNIVQSNCDYGFCHNRASLVLGMLFMYLVSKSSFSEKADAL